MATMGDDLLSERLISQLLENDLLFLESMKEAEKLQLDQVLAVSARSQDHIPESPKTPSPSISETDGDLAIRMYLSDAQTNNDIAFAQSIQNEALAENTASHQYALKLAAAERKINMDAEFARKLQALSDKGGYIDKIKDAESILNENLISTDPNEFKEETNSIKIKDSATSKGKGRQLSSPTPEPQSKRMRLEVGNEEPEISFTSYPTCGICLEPFIATHSPFTASLSANTSSRLPFGLRLPCTCEHPYCISCLTSYIQNELDPEGTGVGRYDAVVFPIRCPGCPLSEWPEGITDDVAERILGEIGMVQWFHRKLLDSIPRLFCPNPNCSQLVETGEDNGSPQAICPFCQKMMCVPCRTAWHKDLTCEEYQAPLPLDERSPEDRLLLELAKAQRWRRCPSCTVIVELVSGCNHMICRCGSHFCFQCGSPTTQKGVCTRKPPCEFWEEDMLLDPGLRRARNNITPVDVRPPAYHPVADPTPEIEDHHLEINLDWMDNPRVLCGRHWFTTHMIRNLSCGYCNMVSNSLADLRYHLEHVERHQVYACCGRFFKQVADFERHEHSKSGRFGGTHTYRMIRNAARN